MLQKTTIQRVVFLNLEMTCKIILIISSILQYFTSLINMAVVRFWNVLIPEI